jgi:DNA mismatch repair protein MutS
MASRCGEPRKFAGFTAAIVDDRRQNLISTRFRFPSIVVMMSAEAQLTPMMAQYRRIKGELPRDALLLFRLGDFYEMFFEDAQAGAQILNLALTARNGVPMCGLPHHAANAYIAGSQSRPQGGHLRPNGRRAPRQLVSREVTQILSPGTHFDERMLVAERNNFLAAVYPSGKIFGLALVDLTTGDFLTTELENEAALLTELERLRPAEIIYPTANRAVSCAICCAARSRF